MSIIRSIEVVVVAIGRERVIVHALRHQIVARPAKELVISVLGVEPVILGTAR
jgi:hypothetical protein